MTDSMRSLHIRSSRAAAYVQRAALCFLLLAAPAAAAVSPQDGAPEILLGRGTPLLSRVWTIDVGLPNNTVEAVTQTRDGYIWIGTWGGLVRFDGVRFTTFDRRNQPGWLSDAVIALHPSRDGGLWIGTLGGGLLSFRKGMFSQVALPSTRVRALCESRSGDLWVAMDRGLARLFPGEPVTVVEALSSTYVNAIHEDPDGTLLLGTSAGLLRYRMGDAAPVRQPFLPQDISVSALWPGNGRILWIGTNAGDLYRISSTRAQRVGSLEGVIWEVVEDGTGSVWVASDRGLMKAGNDGLEAVTYEPGLCKRVLAVFEDREGGVWVGTRYGGLVYLTAGKVASIGQQIEHPNVLTVLEDRRGDFWFGTAGEGLGWLRQNHLKMFSPREGLVSDMIGPVIEGREGRIWFGPRTGDRLHWIEDGGVKSFPLQGSLRSFHEEFDGTLWIGTNSHGLYRLRSGQLKQWTPRDGLPSRAVRWITEDGEGGLWLGTPRGLVQFRERPLTVYTAAHGLKSDWITTIYREPGGPLWIGTFQGGLARFDGGRFTNYGLDEGFCDNQVFAILDDRLGNLWMSSNRGIFSVPKQQLNDVARGAQTRVSCTSYGRSEGMETIQCNGGYQPSAWRARDGRLWFPTAKGLAVVDPNLSHTSNAVPPPVWIEAVQADGRSVPFRGTGRLPAGTKRLEIDYTALSFVAPDRVLFRHRLAGFDTQWVDAGTQRRISYTNLSPGDYQFEVIACNNDGLWNEQGDRWDFRVAPFFYQTPWFYGAVVLLAIATGWGLHRLRVRELRLRNAVLVERAQLSQEIHDHISQIMTGIGLQIDAATESLHKGSGSPATHLIRANQLARQGIEEMRLILRSLREGYDRRKGSRTGLDQALVESVTPLIEGTGVTLRPRREGEPFPLPPGAEHEILHVGQEAVTNALRHGQPRQIDIVVAYEGKGVRITIQDDGRGFEPRAVREIPGIGLGIAGMAARLARQGGTFDIRSRPGEGTTVSAFFPNRAWSIQP